MSMEFKAALSKLKAAPGKSLHFFFIEQGADGKPLMIIDPKRIPKAAQTDALKTAKKKNKCTGTMEMSGSGELELTPRGSAPTGLAKGVQVVARNANAMPKAIVIKDAVADDDEDDEDGGSQSPKPGAVDGGYTTLEQLKASQKGSDPTNYLETNYTSDNYTTENYASDNYANGNYMTEEQVRASTGGGSGSPGPVKLTKEVVERLKTKAAKKFPDALGADPKIAQLMKMRAALLGELAQIRKKGESATDKDFEPVLTKLDKIDEALEAAQRNLNRQGVAPQKLRDEYTDEQNKAGWRADMMRAPEQARGESDEAYAQRLREFEERREQFRESDSFTTKHYTEKERQDAKLDIDAKGRVNDSDGERLRHEKTEYVMDREGELYKFDAKVETDGDGKRKATHHSSVLSGQEVTGAGGIETDGKGRISEISNISGHYKPGRAQMIQTVEVLLKKGALLDTEWVDANGAPLSGKAAKVYEGVMKLQQEIMNKLDDDPSADVKSDLATIATARQMLAKLGCGPSNRISKAKVAFLEIKEGMTGLQVKQAVSDAKTQAKTVEEFLSTGGGSQTDARNKKNMQEELLAKTRDKRTALDQDAEERSSKVKGSAGPTEEELKLMAKELKRRKKALREDDSSDVEDLDDDDWGNDDDEDDGVDPMFAGDTMPERFRKQTVPDPDKSGYVIGAEQLANRKGIAVEELWRSLKDHM